MFTDFLYFLRNEYGQNVSIQEWLTLLKALQLGLHDASFTGFYELCRMILVKRESELDPFDRAFLDYFGSIAERDQVPEQFLQWLEHPNIQNAGLYRQLLAKANLAYSNEDVAKMFRERLATQKEEHNLGNFFVGTGGVSPLGQGGYSPKGLGSAGKAGSGMRLPWPGSELSEIFERTVYWIPGRCRWHFADYVNTPDGRMYRDRIFSGKDGSGNLSECRSAENSV